MEQEYYVYQDEKFTHHESICKRCGECCGSTDGDPCVNLSKDMDGRHFCLIYEKRLGPQKTVNGKVFNCVSIRDIIVSFEARPGCAYRRLG